jgi:hypothetical protein
MEPPAISTCRHFPILLPTKSIKCSVATAENLAHRRFRKIEPSAGFFAVARAVRRTSFRRSRSGRRWHSTTFAERGDGPLLQMLRQFPRRAGRFQPNRAHDQRAGLYDATISNRPCCSSCRCRGSRRVWGVFVFGRPRPLPRRLKRREQLRTDAFSKMAG